MDEAADDIRRRFGNGMIVRGSTMNTAGKVARKAKAQMDSMDKQWVAMDDAFERNMLTNEKNYIIVYKTFDFKL